MSRAFAQMFRTVHIVTTSNVDVMENEDLPLPPNVKIYKASTKDFRSIVRAGNHVSMKKKKSFIYGVLSKLKKTLPFHFYLDEGGQRYIKSATALGIKIIEDNNIKHIYSSFMPYADHLIASKIKDSFPDINWFADFRDLQVEPEYKNVYFENWNRRQEQKIIQSATKVSTVSKGLARHIEKLHHNVISIPRGIEIRETQALPRVFNIVYTGSLFYNYRDGKSVIKIIKQFTKKNKISPDSFQFIYAGREGEIWEKWFEEEGISDYLTNRGFVSRQDAIELQNNANLLLLLTSSSEEHQGVFTGKLFEYLETTAPIINYINGIQDKEFEELFDKTDAGHIYYPQNLPTFQNELLYYYNLWKEGKPKEISKSGRKERENMSWMSRAEELLKE